MIARAEEYLVASVFLFDNMYADNPDPNYDIVGELFGTIQKQKQKFPNLKVVFVLDPLHKGYANRLSPVVAKALEMGVDVFYSDLLGSKASNKLGKVIELIKGIGRVFDAASLGFLGSSLDAVTSAIPLPTSKELDGEKLTLLTLRNAALIKANHRKLLAVKGSSADSWEALISSANPHNASGPSANTALSIKGAGARYIYNVIRADVAHSLLRQEQRPFSITPKAGNVLLSEQSKQMYKGGLKANRVDQYLMEHLPHAPIDFGASIASRQQATRAKFITEEKIKQETLRILSAVQAGDEVRLQMFYLADPVIVDAIIAAAIRKKGDGKPFRILLDANKDAFNSIKDGSPNRQVAHFLTQGSSVIHDFYAGYKNGALKNLSSYEPSSCPGCIEVRWFATHGEQNHAKLISVTSANKNIIFTGSSNWTRKNMGDVGVLGREGPINMESNLAVVNAPSLNKKYNAFFDRVWANNDPKYDLSDSYEKWDVSNSFYLSKGHSLLEEKGLSADEIESLATQRYDEPNPHLAVREYYIQTGKDSGAVMDEAWLKTYMLKWPKGEDTGLVGW